MRTVESVKDRPTSPRFGSANLFSEGCTGLCCNFFSSLWYPHSKGWAPRTTCLPHHKRPLFLRKLAARFPWRGAGNRSAAPAKPSSGNQCPTWRARGRNRASNPLLASLGPYQLRQIRVASTPKQELCYIAIAPCPSPATPNPNPKVQNPNGPFGFWGLDLGFWTLDLGFWILDLGFWIVVVSVLVVAAPNAAVWISDFGAWILDFGSWILDFGSWILDFGSWILDFGSWIFDLGSWILDFGSWILEFGFWILDLGFWILDFGSWILDFGSWILDFGSWILDFGSWILDFGFLERLGFCIRYHKIIATTRRLGSADSRSMRSWILNTGKKYQFITVSSLQWGVIVKHV